VIKGISTNLSQIDKGSFEMANCKMCGEKMETHPSGLCEICRYEQEKLKEVNQEGYKSNVSVNKHLDPVKVGNAQTLALLGSIFGILVGLYVVFAVINPTDIIVSVLQMFGILPLMFVRFIDYMDLDFDLQVLLGIIVIIGNSISLIGAILIKKDPMKGQKILLIGNISGGFNVFTLASGIRLNKARNFD
jgi:hypothetical protein